MDAVSIEDWVKIVLKARDQAIRGDHLARKWLSDYLLGPPEQAIKLSGQLAHLHVTVDYTRDNDTITGTASGATDDKAE
jgi:hypothetical protein